MNELGSLLFWVLLTYGTIGLCVYVVTRPEVVKVRRGTNDPHLLGLQRLSESIEEYYVSVCRYKNTVERFCSTLNQRTPLEVPVPERPDNTIDETLLTEYVLQLHRGASIQETFLPLLNRLQFRAIDWLLQRLVLRRLGPDRMFELLVLLSPHKTRFHHWFPLLEEVLKRFGSGFHGHSYKLKLAQAISPESIPYILMGDLAALQTAQESRP